MGVCADDAEAAGFAGVALHHDLFIVVDAWSDWPVIAGQLASAGAKIHSVRALPQGEAFGVRCRISGVSESVARRLTRAVLDAGIATHARVEHLVLARSLAGGSR